MGHEKRPKSMVLMYQKVQEGHLEGPPETRPMTLTCIPVAVKPIYSVSSPSGESEGSFTIYRRSSLKIRFIGLKRASYSRDSVDNFILHASLAFLKKVFRTEISGPTGPFQYVSDPTTGLYGKLPYVPDALNSRFFLPLPITSTTLTAPTT